MIKFAYFGTPEISASILEEISSSLNKPSLVVTTPDRKAGRGLLLTPSPVKKWATDNGVEILQPEKIKNTNFKEELLTYGEFDLFIVVAYGKILPKDILDIPAHGTLNLHFSLLPKYRGASPVESQILNDEKNLGVSIIKLDEELDHGPIIAEKRLALDEGAWPLGALSLEKKFAEIGASLLIETVPNWIMGKIKESPQDHSSATVTNKIKKEDGLINLNDDPWKNYLKIKAFEVWPRAYFLDKNGKRVIITNAQFEDGKLEIKRVIPEGKSERDYVSN